MFPTVRVTFAAAAELAEHADAGDKFLVLMDILPIDDKRYRYAYHKSCWQNAGKADPPSPTRLYLHPDSPFTRDQLKKQVISFEKVKLTNNDENKHGHVSTTTRPPPRLRLLLTFAPLRFARRPRCELSAAAAPIKARQRPRRCERLNEI